MLLKKAGCSGSAPIGVTDLRCRPGLLEQPLGTLQTAAEVSPTKQQKIKALENGAIPQFGADPEDPALFRSIRITPPS
jgi:hypothetical protein